ncbi:MAG: double-strand break repair helicase AddA [Alphaproteobacteria bacterium]
MAATRPSPSSPAPSATSQQQAAADPSLSAWVAASAGTGKTKVLTDRVLRLLVAGTPPGRILCLTFTNAAAAEMALRIERQLGVWAVSSEGELEAVLHVLTGEKPDDALRSRARRLFAETLDVPGGLKIMTIHAFCQSLLRRFPLEAGIAPHFEVIDERTAAERLAAARDAVLESASRGTDVALAEALAEVTSRLQETAFATLMGELSQARGRLRALLDRHGGVDGLIAATDRLLGVAPGDTVEAVLAGACAETSFDAAALRTACRALDSGSDADRERAARITAWLADPTRRAARFEAYLGAFFTADGGPRKTLATKAVHALDPAAEETLRLERARLVPVIERRKAITVARATAGLLRLGDALLGEYERRKRTRARLDYDDLILHTSRLLGRTGAAAWVLYKLDGGLDHILLDEAQDTSPEQWQVIAALAEEFFAGEGARETPRTVFFVGDEKQSIFSFQGADLQELERMRAYCRHRVRAAGRSWGDKELGLSFRSTEAVLTAVDRIFAQDVARDGVAFAVGAIAHEAHRKGQAGLVEVWPPVVRAKADRRRPWEPPVERTGIDDPPHRLAVQIARTMHRWLDQGKRLDSQDRPIRPGDVMVLLRRRAPLADLLVRELKRLNVPVAGADRMVLTDQIAVMDLVALGQFLFLPEDDLTLATVLKGPLVGLDEEALFALAHDRGDERLWRTLERRRREHDAFARAHDYLAAVLARADYVPPFEFYSELLGAPPAHAEAQSGRAALLHRLGMEAGDPIDEFLSLALAYERVHPPSLQGFLHWLAAGEAEVKRDMEQGRDEVRVMTVHGAKGLQAPIVVLPDTMQVPRPPGPQILWHQEDGGALLWAPRRDLEEASCRATRQAKETRERQEYRRLLYVALTRAEDRLYICGWRGSKTEPEDCWYRLVTDALKDVAETFDFDCTAAAADGWPGGWSGRGLRLAGRQEAPPEWKAGPPGLLPLPPELPAFARTPAPAEPTPPRPLAPSRPAAAEPPAGSPLAGAGDRAPGSRGRLVHRLIELLPEVAPEARAEACRRLLAHRGHGLDPGTQAALAERVLAILGDPRFAPLFGPSSRAEVPVIGRVGDVVIAGQVDRLVVDDDAVLIVDFKTNRPPPPSEAEVPPAYLKQMAAYRAVLSEIYPDRPVRCALLWTEGPLLMPLSHTSLAAHAP